MNLLDLPCEILLMIFGKLKTVDIVYSLVDINQRFDNIVFNLVNLHDIKLVTTMNMNSFFDFNYSIDEKVISRFCDGIFFRISDQIHRLTIEHDSMKQILSCCTYPQLDSLTIINCEEEKFYQDLRNRNLRNLLAKQIKYLHIDMKMNELYSKTIGKVYWLIMRLCEKLIDLNFCDTSKIRTHYIQLSRFPPKMNNIYSTLVKLQLKVFSLVDCIYVLEAPFECLEILIIDVKITFRTELSKQSLKTIPKVKYFSLSCLEWTDNYELFIVPLLRRMRYVEELRLYLNLLSNHLYTDDHLFDDQFLVYMTNLKKFTFSIQTSVIYNDITAGIQFNEQIRNSFTGKGYEQIGLYVHHDFNEQESRCHIYSLPYDFDYFIELTGSFQGGNFDKVRFLTINDSFSLKQELLQIICQSFPFVEYLSISVEDSFQRKQDSSTVLHFRYLTTLDIGYSNIDYVEEFLLKTNAYLPCLVDLRIEYHSLIFITNNFTTDSTIFNFQRLRSLDVCQSFVRPQTFSQYFPLL